mmetsp:Transcript_27043/g.75552  ORF Transcript_27043/g.75552 Transcript_27043/m.75552 type:complete len:306 (-) Transcript_27043:29-946(-)
MASVKEAIDVSTSRSRSFMSEQEQFRHCSAAVSSSLLVKFPSASGGEVVSFSSSSGGVTTSTPEGDAVAPSRPGSAPAPAWSPSPPFGPSSSPAVPTPVPVASAPSAPASLLPPPLLSPSASGPPSPPSGAPQRTGAAASATTGRPARTSGSTWNMACSCRIIASVRAISSTRLANVVSARESHFSQRTFTSGLAGEGLRTTSTVIHRSMDWCDPWSRNLWTNLPTAAEEMASRSNVRTGVAKTDSTFALSFARILSTFSTSVDSVARIVCQETPDSGIQEGGSLSTLPAPAGGTPCSWGKPMSA